jgi:hypothetical protein
MDENDYEPDIRHNVYVRNKLEREKRLAGNGKQLKVTS